MESKSSLNRSIDSAAKHYSSMFSLPSFKKALFAVAVICFVVGFSALVAHPSPGLTGALVLGFSLFVLTLTADLMISKLVLRSDPIYSLRRTLTLSLVGWLFWLFFIVIGVALSFPFGWLLWVKLSLLGFAAVITLRGVVFIATSTAATWRKLVSVLLNPTLCMVGFLVFWAFWVGISHSILIKILLFVVGSPVIACLAVFLFLSSINRLGQKTYSTPSLPLFRAFILDWAVGLNAPIEELFEKTGENADIEVTLLKFDASKPKAAIIVPLVHPGPFKNVGSSLLPSLLKHEYEKEFGCDACVPLGILGHELDLASQAQNQKIVSQVLASAKFKATADLASPYVKVTEGVATASCQIFGDTVFLSFTLAPKTTEDLPQELGRMVNEEATKYGLKSAMVVNTHNSINDIVDTEKYLDALQIAASKCIQKAVALPTKPFMVGAATVFPKEFTLKDGMGTGGITAIVVQVEKQKTAYVVIDGNNMISGLREKILAALASVGFDESEVFTTDTHAVSAIVTGRRAGRRGYHPVGEVMSHEILIRYICDLAKKAEANLEASKAGCIHFVVPQVRVIGEARLQSMTTLVDKSIKKAKQMLLPVFGLEGLILILLLMLI
jgi:putative membrane protein